MPQSQSQCAAPCYESTTVHTLVARRKMSSFQVVDPPTTGARYVFGRRKGDAWAKDPRHASPQKLGQPAPKTGAATTTTGPTATVTTDLVVARGGGSLLVAAGASPTPHTRVAVRSKSMTELEHGPRCWGTHGCRGTVTRKCLTCEEFGWLRPGHLCDECFSRLHVSSVNRGVVSCWKQKQRVRMF